jgi:hypothetical protein
MGRAPEIKFTLEDKEVLKKKSREAREASIEFELDCQIRKGRKRLEKQ